MPQSCQCRSAFSVHLGLLKKLNLFCVTVLFFVVSSGAGGVAFLQGVFEKSGVCVMVFCGEVVVFCW